MTVGEKVEVAGLLTKAETGAPVYAYYVCIQNGDNQGTALGQLVSLFHEGRERFSLGPIMEVHGEEIFPIQPFRSLEVTFLPKGYVLEDHEGNAVLHEHGIDICDGMSFTIANASQYPYLLEIVSPTMELTGEIVMDSPQEP